MTRIFTRQESGPWKALLFSAAFHLAFYFILLKADFYAPTIKEEPVYYVDMVNLPVANPQAGSPTTESGAPAPPAAPAPKPQPKEMALPEKAPKAKSKAEPAKNANTPNPAEEYGKSFEERLAKLQNKVEAGHEEATLEALRKKVAGKGKSSPAVGIPKGTGTEAGSDYANYIQSRLRDAFSTTITYQSKAPEVLLKLTIDKNGRVIRRRIEKSSGDRIFESAVNKAVTTAEKTFPPPPDGKEFEYGYIFRPQGVSSK